MEFFIVRSDLIKCSLELLESKEVLLLSCVRLSVLDEPALERDFFLIQYFSTQEVVDFAIHWLVLRDKVNT